MAKAEKRPPGRPTTYTLKAADEICDRLADGEYLRVICRDEHMPAWRTVYHWIEADKDFAARIARAREMGREAIMEDTLVIADTPEEGVETEISETGKKEKRGDMLGHRKLKIETRFKILAKWDPKKYGEKITHSGDPDAPVALILNGSDVHG
ncbi:terminase small subunit protein [Burkholderia sp. Bp8984]|uniref:terminase small subunit-like protein n=1 Tax=Burkholderia sp. Bp8984 TaxID=2184549 RepID=UPI000F598E9E|nr:terminase small subunit protein [Burkholderia sp. Bp8984]RQS63847.1 terminase small subunit protein [Burkholderia sp. Bp8984]